MIGHLIPEKMQSYFMGIVLMAYGISSMFVTGISGYLIPGDGHMARFITNEIYYRSFLTITVISILISLVMFLFMPKLNKLSDEY